MQNPFTLSFGKKPYEYISRISVTDEIMGNFTADHPSSQVYMLTGVRGSGKTVTMAGIANRLEEEENWIVVELNPTRNLLNAFAAKLYEKERLVHLFLKAKLDLSVLGIGVSIEGASPVTDIEVAIERMLKIIKEKNIRVLITIDEVTGSDNVKEFVSAFQIYMRQEYPVFLLMTGLYENIYALQNGKNVTFLYRAPKIQMTPLDLGAIVRSYKEIFGISLQQAGKMAEYTMGYPFAYQVLGYLCFQNHCPEEPEKIFPDYDQRLSEYVYQKIWSELSVNDRKVAASMTNTRKVSEIMEEAGMDKSTFSRYRMRLIKKGIAYSPARGELRFLLPRFSEFIRYSTLENEYL